MIILIVAFSGKSSSTEDEAATDDNSNPMIKVLETKPDFGKYQFDRKDDVFMQSMWE